MEKERKKTGDTPFHTAAEAEVMTALGTTERGLSSAESSARLERYGPNDVSQIRQRPLLVQYLSHFKNLLVIILILAALVSIFAGELTSAVIIIVIVVASVTLDFFQEYKAGNAAELLRQKIITKAAVWRDGESQELPITVLVPGDIISLSAGDIIPADARILSSRDLFVNQSALTGEPFPVEKAPGVAAPGTPLAEAENYLFLGTSVVSGTATAAVTTTGSSTEFGHVAKSLVSRPPETEFERGLRQFSYLMSKIIFSLVIVVFFINAFFRHGLLDSLLFSIALAVGMTPELLPMILSLNLSKGAIAMSEKGAIVKHPESIQNFGSMDILCTDKTGTLTENQILSSTILTLKETTARPYVPTPTSTACSAPVSKARSTMRWSGSGTSISATAPRSTRSRSILSGNGYPSLQPVTTAPSSYRKGPPRRSSVSALARNERGVSSRSMTRPGSGFSGSTKSRVSRDSGHSLSVTVTSVPPRPDSLLMTRKRWSLSASSPSLTRQRRAPGSRSASRRSGIDLKILTGDNELVTRKTCELIGLPVKGVIRGAEIENLDNEGLARVVDGVTIFSRMTPVEKNRVMNALKHNGHVVGFMGDGINDAPSIREADVGISVENAVDIAKESADIILVRSDLRILNDGVLEGRKTFGNTMKYILMGKFEFRQHVSRSPVPHCF